jgi:hypothetical protein
MRRGLSVGAAVAVAGAALAATASPHRMTAAADCSKTSVGLTPLTELGRGRYHGFEGGLYPAGKNAPPRGYLKLGLAQARRVKPIDGRIVLLSIGMSNTTMEFSVFKQLADRDQRKNPRLTIVDGAQGGWDADRINQQGAQFWATVDQRLGAAGATGRQVEVVWLKEALAGPSDGFPGYARRLQRAERQLVVTLRQRFPNLRLVYLSSRIYAGYASSPLNPEPYAYESGFSVKWLVRDRIRGRIKGPWLGWGPYLWADGLHARRDGLTWACDDFRPDGTHPSPAGAQKVASLLLRFFTTSPTAKPWFVR